MRKGAKAKKMVCLGMAAMLAVSGIRPEMVRADEFLFEEKAVLSAENAEEDSWKYTELEDGTLEITGYNGNDTELVIPVEIDGKSVTSIGFWAFKECSSLTSITIPESVISIGMGAFEGCSSLVEILVDENNIKYSCENGTLYDKEETTLVCCPAGKIGDFYISENVTSIGNSAFYGCSSLTSITIPENVTSIEYSAFEGCSSLTSITIPENVTSIGGSAFYGCSSLTSITIPENVTSIGYSAFGGCSSLTSITIPENVTSIESFAFWGCSSLTSITIPENVTSIEPSAFEGCSSLTEILVDGNNKEYSCENGVVYNKNRTTVVVCPGGKEGDFHIPEGVTSIGYIAFWECSSLTSIIIPESVTSIGGEAFYGCSSLASIIIPESVTNLEYGAFYGCSSLTSIEIPSNTIVGEKALGYWWNENIGESVKQENFIIKCYSGSPAETYAVNNGFEYHLVGSDSNTENNDNNSDKTDVDTPKEPVVEDTEQSDTTNPTINLPAKQPEIVLPEQNQVIHKQENVTVGLDKYKVTSEDEVIYLGITDKKTKKVIIPKTITVNGTKYKVTAIADKAFKNAKITNLTIGSNIKVIGTSAFENCKNLTKVTLGGGVTKINKNAFKNCKKLKTITIKSTKLKTVGKNAFKGIKSTAKIKVPKKKLTGYKKLLKKAGISKKVSVVK